MYSYQRFRTELEQPIVQHKDEDAAKRLQRLIRPFVLRRLKKEVLQDLPDKLEENLYADMDGEQQELYDAHVRRMKLMLEEKSDEEIRTDKIEILAELTRLRQLCCDPALLYDNYKGGSAKTELCLVYTSSQKLSKASFSVDFALLSDRWKWSAVSFRGWSISSAKPKRYQR